MANANVCTSSVIIYVNALNVLVLLNGSFTELSEFLITCCSVLSATVNVFSY